MAVLGGDGRFHNVHVPWDEYLPLEEENHFFVSKYENKQNTSVMATRNGLCIYK